MNSYDISTASVVMYTTQQGNFACLEPNYLDLTYQVTPLVGKGEFHTVQRVLQPVNLQAIGYQKYSLQDPHAWIKEILFNIQKHVENICKIGPRLGFTVEHNGLNCFVTFKEWVLAHKAEETTLDLNGLGLTLVPTHIGLFSKLVSLNISNNQLRILPVEIQRLSALKIIDLRGNPIIGIPDWLKARTDLQILSDIKEPDVNHWAQLS